LVHVLVRHRPVEGAGGVLREAVQRGVDCVDELPHAVLRDGLALAVRTLHEPNQSILTRPRASAVAAVRRRGRSSGTSPCRWQPRRDDPSSSSLDTTAGNAPTPGGLTTSRSTMVSSSVSDN